MQLEVEIKTGAYEAIKQAAVEAGSDEAQLRKSLQKIVSADEALGSEAALILSDLDTWFTVAPMLSSPAWWQEQERVRAHFEEQAQPAVRLLIPFLPEGCDELNAKLTVHLVPGFFHCYGPRDGVQVFGIRPGAEPAEALLFLVHVYYHELSSLFYTQKSAAVSRAQLGPDDLKHWLLLLIQNEGLANYVVLDQLLALLPERESFAYFTYARVIHDTQATAQAFTFLRRLMEQLDEHTWAALQGRITEILKDPRLPVINLAGIRMAEAIAHASGEPTLLQARREPQEFFRLYANSGDDLVGVLFGPTLSSAAAFGLDSMEPAPIQS